ncbi:hypothetical protein PM082_024390 [Marasmius tenuissimus]|nr:hypothetical protein PM082_024390 [Marasmius tenuissimus]
MSAGVISNTGIARPPRFPRLSNGSGHLALLRANCTTSLGENLRCSRIVETWARIFVIGLGFQEFRKSCDVISMQVSHVLIPI